jgi:hypothetical protein
MAKKSNMIEASETIFNELIQLRRDFRGGRISQDTFAAELAAISQVERQQKIILQTFVAEKKFRSRIDVNLIADTDPNKEMVSCPDQDGKFITRPMCLDYSGEEKNHAACSTCSEYPVTRKLLLPPR